MLIPRSSFHKLRRIIIFIIFLNTCQALRSSGYKTLTNSNNNNDYKCADECRWVIECDCWCDTNLLDGCVSIADSSMVRDLGEKNDNPMCMYYDDYIGADDRR